MSCETWSKPTTTTETWAEPAKTSETWDCLSDATAETWYRYIIETEDCLALTTEDDQLILVEAA